MKHFQAQKAPDLNKQRTKSIVKQRKETSDLTILTPRCPFQFSNLGRKLEKFLENSFRKVPGNLI